jgi:hypothetical protein
MTMVRVLVIVMFLPLISFGQPREKGKAGFHSIIGTGAMIGETKTKAFFHYSGGLQYDRYFTGIGMGYDAYRLNTIPVFADWRMNFGSRRVLFIYANVGVNFAANLLREEKTDYSRSFSRPGLYTDGGIGYRWPLGNSQQLSLSVGHSYKQVTDVHEFSYPCGIVPCSERTPTITNAYRYNFGRIVVKTGWEFGK